MSSSSLSMEIIDCDDFSDSSMSDGRSKESKALCLYDPTSDTDLSIEEYEENDSEEEDSEKASGSKRKKSKGKKRGRWTRLLLKEHEKTRYLDNYMNPAFKVDRSLKRSHDLRIPLVRDYDLKFPKFIILVDKVGKLKRRMSFWKSNTNVLKNFGSVIRRNDLKESDGIICELKVTNDGLVFEIKVHIISGPTITC